MWKTTRSSLENTGIVLKNHRVFHNFDCGECGKLSLSFSVLFAQKTLFFQKNLFLHCTIYCPFFCLKAMCILYEAFAFSFFRAQRLPRFFCMLCARLGAREGFFSLPLAPRRSASFRMRAASSPNTRVSLLCFFRISAEFGTCCAALWPCFPAPRAPVRCPAFFC